MQQATKSRLAGSNGLAMVVVMTGVLITAVDTTIVVLALPEIERGLHISLTSVIWVVIGYLLVITLLATQVGRLGDMFGRVRMYEAGFLLFVAGSLACALAWNEAAIIGFRIVQGIGGAFVTANSGAIIADLYPPERRGRAYGYNALGWSVGAVLGIVLGGLIVTYVSWRWIFWINVPIGIGAVLLATRVLSDRGERARRSLDPAGMAALGLGLFGILWAMTKLATASLDATTIGYLVGGVFFLGVFVVVELRHPAPMLNLSLLRIPTLTPSLLASLFQGLANYATLFLVIMYLQGPRALSPIHASLLLIPGYVIGSALGPVAGRLADRVGPVLPATVGLGIQVVALFIYAHLALGTGLWVVVAASVVNGAGSSFFFPSNSAAVMKVSPPQVFGVTSGMLRTFANIGMVFSFTVAILIASRSISKGLAFAIFVGTTTLHGHLAAAFTTGLHASFYASMGFMALAALLSASRSAGRLLGRAAPAGFGTAATPGSELRSASPARAD
ncbi:MAG TPA: MFS transporter [Candidatus Dormibacteraeota bacterium]|nr:MFS transporter [Candidatus Dormibacteraeota bacterium]